MRKDTSRHNSIHLNEWVHVIQLFMNTIATLCALVRVSCVCYTLWFNGMALQKRPIKIPSCIIIQAKVHTCII